MADCPGPAARTTFSASGKIAASAEGRVPGAVFARPGDRAPRARGSARSKGRPCASASAFRWAPPRGRRVRRRRRRRLGDAGGRRITRQSNAVRRGERGIQRGRIPRVPHTVRGADEEAALSSRSPRAGSPETPTAEASTRCPRVPRTAGGPGPRWTGGRGRAGDTGETRPRSPAEHRWGGGPSRSRGARPPGAGRLPTDLAFRRLRAVTAAGSIPGGPFPAAAALAAARTSAPPASDL